MNKAKIQYDRRVRPSAYQQGDLVLLENREILIGKKKKLAKRTTGPYEIIQKLSNHNYRIKLINSNKRTKVVNKAKLRKFHQRADDQEDSLIEVN